MLQRIPPTLQMKLPLPSIEGVSAALTRIAVRYSNPKCSDVMRTLPAALVSFQPMPKRTHSDAEGNQHSKEETPNIHATRALPQVMDMKHSAVEVDCGTAAPLS